MARSSRLYTATRIPIKIPTPPRTVLAIVALSPTLRPVEPGERFEELDVVEEMSEVVGVAGLDEVRMDEETDEEVDVGELVETSTMEVD
jgi:hypothetical protein